MSGPTIYFATYAGAGNKFVAYMNARQVGTTMGAVKRIGPVTVIVSPVTIGSIEDLTPCTTPPVTKGILIVSEGRTEIVDPAIVVEFDFTEKLAPVFSTNNFEVISIEIQQYYNHGGVDDAYNQMPITGIVFENSRNNKDTMQDDYITPDLSLTPPKDEPVFREIGDYPSSIGVYQQRLVLAATEKQPFTFWMSCTGDLYNFNTHESIREDDAIEATLAATEFPRINHIVMNRDLMIFCDSGEWLVKPVSGNSLSYKTVSAKMQSAIGCSKDLKPVCVGDEILFVDRKGETLRATRYNWASDGYESQDLSVLSQRLFKANPIVRMAYKQHPDSTLVCVLADGTIATLVYMREHEVVAWSRQMMGGGWKVEDVASSKAIHNATTEILYIVENDGELEIWKDRDDIPYRKGAAIADHVALDGAEMILPGRFVNETVPEGKVAIDIETARVVPSGETLDENRTYIMGYPFESRLVTIYPEASEKESIQFEIKNATETEVRAIEGSSFTVKPYGTEEKFARKVELPVTADEEGLKLGDKDAKIVLYGMNTRDGRIELKHSEPWPLNILSVGTTYQIEIANKGGSNEA